MKSKDWIMLASFTLILIGVVLIIDDLITHQIAWYGFETGNEFLDDVIFEHWLYGFILVIMGAIPIITRRR